MKEIIDSIILGLVQGLTEFLPVSSSGHLILIREWLGLSLENTISFDILLHLATLFAIIICFWGDIVRIFIDFRSQGFSARSSNLLKSILVGTIPAVLVGFFLGDFLEQTFRNPKYVALALVAGSLLFWLTDKFAKQKGGISTIKGFGIGIFQALALIPGVSRSGSTISGGLLFGLSRVEAIRFSFLLGIPAIIGALLKTLLDIGPNFLDTSSQLLNLNSLVAFVVAFLSGLLAVRFLVRYLSTHSFMPFIIYRIILAGMILIFL